MKQLDPKAVWFFFISFVLRWFIVVVGLGLFGLAFLSRLSENFNNGGQFSFIFLKWLWVIILAFIGLCYIWAQLTYHFYRYELTDAGFRKELGVIYKKYVTIPYDRIQNVDIYRGILARILGLSDLNIQTAGASVTLSRYGIMGVGAEGRLPALSRETAEQIRDELIQRARQFKSQGV
ncbi:MAG: PH domain-containing protein [Candidatus Doudnabacteria bacterium]|nr:PH domain-containing protein [Candidatus Doudnabacteria bacterium]